MENEAVPPLLQSAHGTFLPKILRGSQMSPKAPLDTRLETADFQRPDGGILASLTGSSLCLVRGYLGPREGLMGAERDSGREGPVPRCGG